VASGAGVKAGESVGLGARGARTPQRAVPRPAARSRSRAGRTPTRGMMRALAALALAAMAARAAAAADVSLVRFLPRTEKRLEPLEGDLEIYSSCGGREVGDWWCRWDTAAPGEGGARRLPSFFLTFPRSS
jgi:hypothetical protein